MCFGKSMHGNVREQLLTDNQRFLQLLQPHSKFMCLLRKWSIDVYQASLLIYYCLLLPFKHCDSLQNIEQNSAILAKHAKELVKIRHNKSTQISLVLAGVSGSLGQKKSNFFDADRLV